MGLKIGGAEHCVARGFASDARCIVDVGRYFDRQAVALGVRLGQAAHHHRDGHQITHVAIAKQELGARGCWREQLRAAVRIADSQRDEGAVAKTDAADSEQHVSAALPKGVKPELVADMTLPNFTTEFNMVSLKANLDLAVKHKVVKNFDVNTMMWKQ